MSTRSIRLGACKLPKMTITTKLSIFRKYVKLMLQIVWSSNVFNGINTKPGGIGVSLRYKWVESSFLEYINCRNRFSAFLFIWIESSFKRHHSWEKKKFEIKGVWNVLLWYDIISFKRFFTNHLEISNNFRKLL